MSDTRCGRRSRAEWALARRTPVLAAVAVLVVVFSAASLGASTPRTPSNPRLTFTGAVTGTAKGGIVECVTSTQAQGRELAVSIINFRLPSYPSDSLSLVFAGANLAPGKYELGGTTTTSTGVPVNFAAGKAKRFFAQEGSGTATLNKDKKSGKLDGDLAEGAVYHPTGGPGTHVTGSFKCERNFKH